MWYLHIDENNISFLKKISYLKFKRDSFIIDRGASRSWEIICLLASVRLSVCCIMHVLRSGRYMGSACRVLRKITWHVEYSPRSLCICQQSGNIRNQELRLRSRAFNFVQVASILITWKFDPLNCLVKISNSHVLGVHSGLKRCNSLWKFCMSIQ